MVPAHNEQEVIEDTVHALAAQDYPQERFEIIVVNDASTDSTGPLLDALAARYPQLKVLHIPRGVGGKGKSRTLNLGLPHARGEVIAVYDADNTPEPETLRLLVQTLRSDARLVAVNGKVRTRNYAASWLTRFINLEFMYFQWIFQGGRWYWLRLSTLMGTNYVIWRSYLTALGGFDEKSLVDDTEMSFRLLSAGRRVRWVPFATTWEQEPDTLRVWFKQRVRWSKGNFYVTFKYLPQALLRPYPIGVELLHFVLNFLVFFPALIMSTLILVLGLLGIAQVTLPGPFTTLWVMAYLVYVAQMSFVISLEQPGARNYLLGALSYFSYAQLFIPVSIAALRDYVADTVLKREVRWVKTARTKEKP
nr:glycosyltransferase family 2 protein [Deinobacterium chartae]